MRLLQVKRAVTHRQQKLSYQPKKQKRNVFESRSNCPIPTKNVTHLLSRDQPTYLIFGANTDVGKSIVSTSLVKSTLSNFPSSPSYYVKPLQCGGSDQGFVEKYTEIADRKRLKSHTLYEWNMPASPHLASRSEKLPASDEEVLSSINSLLSERIINESGEESEKICTWIETAGGVLSPSAASPHNKRPRHSRGTEDANNTANSWGWSTQADLYQPIRLPCLLVGDGRLGGISSSISALESLILRGYDIHGIVMIEDSEKELSGFSGGQNAQALREYVSRSLRLRSGSGRALFSKPEEAIISLPSLPPNPEPLYDWFDSDEVIYRTSKLRQGLIRSWEDHVDTLHSLQSQEVLWWPFTQHKPIEGGRAKSTLIDGAAGDYFSVISSSSPQSNVLHRDEYFDACASWWTQGLGHGDSSTALSAASAAGRYGHVLFPDIIHEPATVLSQKLVDGPGKGWASRVFFSDDGSTAMEVAIKMGMRKFCTDKGLMSCLNGDIQDEGSKKVLTICAQQDCYHGDTLGVMDVAEPSIFNSGQHPWYQPMGLFLSYPTMRYKDGILGLSSLKNHYASGENFESIESVLDIESRLDSYLYHDYRKNIEKDWCSYEEDEKQMPRLIASLVIEPILLGAGGMKFIDPLWQRALIDVAKSKSVPVIFDEVATGIFRLGVQSCREILQVNPDIASYAKLLTAGLVPMSVTLASEDVFNTFLGDSKAEALLHGHSYTAHPLGCVTAIHALDTFDHLFGGNSCSKYSDGSQRQYFDLSQVSELSKLPQVQEAMSLGTVVAVTIHPDGTGAGYAASSAVPIVKKLLDRGIYVRPLGNVLYIMVSPLTSHQECNRLLEILIDCCS